MIHEKLESEGINQLNSSESELMEVEGIGKITAQNIRKVIDSKYRYFKKEVKERKLFF